MSEPRKPIFGFLWPRPDPNAPVDAAYRQVRPVRISPRGPIRLAVLLVGTAALAIGTGTVILGAATSGLSPITVAFGGVAATGLFLLLRGWVVGTYVTDDRLVIETTWHRTALPWDQVRAVERRRERGPMLGMPARLPATRVVVTGSDGKEHATHVYSTSPDHWLRSESFDMAALRLERWRQAGGPS